MNKWTEERAKLANALWQLRNKPPANVGRIEWNRELLHQARHYGKR